MPILWRVFIQEGGLPGRETLHLRRVKKEFVLDGVLYPVGAFRCWTSDELNNFITKMENASLEYNFYFESMEIM